MIEITDTMNKTKQLIIANIISFVAVLFVNFLANALPLNGRNTGQLSDDFPNLFVPAGLTFSIWAVIYTMLLLWVVQQARALFNQNIADKIAPHIQQVAWWFVISSCFNIAWLFAWHWSLLPLSLVLMLGILYSLVQINLRTRNGITSSSRFEKYLGHTTFGIYQGWITVATIANVTALLVTLGFDGGPLSQSTWTIVMITVGAALALYMLLKLNILFHGLAVAWAFLGIYIKRNALADANQVAIVALSFTFILCIVIVVRLKKWWVY
jgi:hypothetical protein